MKFMSKRNLALALILLAGAVGGVLWRRQTSKPAPVPIPSVTVLTVLPDRQQTLKGWGIYPCTYQIERPNAGLYHIFDRPNVQRLIFKELGASFIRCNIYPNSYDSKKDNGSLDTKYLDAGLVRHLKLAASYGQYKYLLTVWSPPEVFKDPPTHLGVDGKTQRASVLRPDREADYCRYVVKVLDYLTKQKGFPPPIAYSVQNEPTATPVLWDGTTYTPEQWRRVTIEMRAALDKAGYKNVPLIGPDDADYERCTWFMGGVSAPSLQLVPGFSTALAGFAFHGYLAASDASLHSEELRSVALAVQARRKDVWMSEWSITEPLELLDHTLTVAQRLGREMTYIPCNYWTWWQGWYNQHPKGEVLITGKDDNKLHISKTYYFLKQLWHLVPAGSVVHQVNTNDPEINGYDPLRVQTVAFESPGHMTLMVVNPTPAVKTVRLTNPEGVKLQHFLTAEGRDMAPQVVSGSQVQLPPRSISLLVWKQEAVDPGDYSIPHGS